jgi:hypothetical protein
MNAGLVLLLVAALAGLIAWIWMLVVAFQNKQTMWGVALLVSGLIGIGPLVALAFMVMHWSIAKTPGIIFLSSTALGIVGAVMVASSMQRQIAELQEQAAFSMDEEAMVRNVEPPPAPEPPEETTAQDLPPAEPALTPTRAASASPSQRPTPLARPPVSSRELLGTDEVEEQEAPRRVRDRRISPVTVHVVKLGDPTPTRMRILRLRLGNPTEREIAEITLRLEYLDDRGNELGRWRTVHTASETLARSASTNEIDVRAFFVPLFTRRARVAVEGVAFADGERWP